MIDAEKALKSIRVASCGSGRSIMQSTSLLFLCPMTFRLVTAEVLRR